jgi:hypothetical protein
MESMLLCFLSLDIYFVALPYLFYVQSKRRKKQMEDRLIERSVDASGTIGISH